MMEFGIIIVGLFSIVGAFSIYKVHKEEWYHYEAINVTGTAGIIAMLLFAIYYW